MKNEDLFQLRIKVIQDFTNPNDLVRTLDSLFDEKLNIPLIVGNRNFPQETWKVVPLVPSTTSDRLTVANFLEGLKQVQAAYAHNRIKETDFNAGLYFEGIDILHCGGQDTTILRVNLDRYHLGLFLNHVKSAGDPRNTYGAASEREVMPLEQILEKYLGPNRTYERTLI